MDKELSKDIQMTDKHEKMFQSLIVMGKQIRTTMRQPHHH